MDDYNKLYYKTEKVVRKESILLNVCFEEIDPLTLVKRTSGTSQCDCVEVVLRHFHRCPYRSSPLWFFCWRDTDRSGSWLSGNTVDTKIYVVRAAGA
jgi:hypothetical protein